MLNLLFAAALFTPQGPGSSTAPVVINEFSYDDSSTDNFEFIELYNRTNAPVDISGWRILNPDSTGPTYGSGTGVDLSYVIPAATTIPAGGFYVLGPATVPNVNQIIGTINLLENDTEALELRDAADVIVDSLAWELGFQGAFGPHPQEGNGFYGDLAVGDGIGNPTSATGRMFDGYDNNDNGRDFLCNLIPTPGASNLPLPTLPFADNFDTGVAGSPITTWSGGWVLPRYVDPTAITAENLSVKPYSPQGGLVMSTWDRTGGGNTVQLVAQPVADVVFESWVWLETAMVPFNPAPYTPTVPPVMLNNYNLGDGEWWAVGVRGTAGPNSNPPNVGGYFNTISLGVGTRYHFVTGIAWAHFRTPTNSDLYLIDFGNGASVGNPTNFTILAGPIAIVPTVNDGWQRLRLHVQGDQVIANFGGTYGCDDGQRYVATTTTSGPGGVYIAYREAVLYNNNGGAGCRPPLWDDMTIHAPTTTRTFFGTASPTSLGTPNIGSNGFAMPGSPFVVTGTGMMPAGGLGTLFCAYVVGFQSIPTGFPISGAPPTALGYVAPIAGSAIGFANALGEVGFPLGIPCNASYLGTYLAHQLVDFDLTLPFGLPLGTSRCMETIIGN
jgi:hypothetical protein